MQINSAVIHAIRKNKETVGPNSVTINPRGGELKIDERLESLGSEILSLYGKLSNAYGTMGEDFAIHRFPSVLQTYFDGEVDFLNFTRTAISLISESMSRQQFATTSYPIIFRYSNQGRDWLLIAVLKLKEGVGIDEETLDLNDSLFFDIGNLREAARIDLVKWQENQQPYLSFIKRGAGRDTESSLYFREALSCIEYTDAKRNTDNAIEAANQFSMQQEWDPERRQLMRANILEYCKNKKDRGEPVNMIALSSIIDDQNPMAFNEFARENNYEINESFFPHHSSFIRLQRFSKRFGTISIGFDAEDIFQERVFHDPKNSSIIIKDPPQDLIDQINQAKGLD